MLEVVYVRWGRAAHITFFFFAVLTNLLVSLSMLQGAWAFPINEMRCCTRRSLSRMSLFWLNISAGHAGCVSAVNALTGVDVYGVTLHPVAAFKHAALRPRSAPQL